MTQTGGQQGTYPTYPGFNFGGISQDIQGIINPIGGQVGNQTPEWEFPLGQDRVPASVRDMFLRADAGPSGLNQFLQNADPKVIDELRSAINMGVLRPKNQAAQQISQGYGGLRAGDQTILGPMMDDMPSGLSPEYWQQANNLIQTMVNAKLEAAKQSGYLDGVPTVQREQMMQQLAQGWKAQFTDEFRAQEQSRANKAQEGLSQQEINNQNMQAMAGLMGGTVNPQTGEFQQTEQGREFDISQQSEMGGWMPNGQATLGREQQAWNQAKDVAQLASNPRNYMEAQMLGNARGGLGGMQPSNQINSQMTAAGPGGNPMAWMQSPGTSGQGTMAQAGAPGDDRVGIDDPGYAPPDPSIKQNPAFNGGQWSDWLNQANAAQNNARDSMMAGQAGAAGAASNLSPGPGSPGMVGSYPGYQGGTTPQPGQPGEGMSDIWMGMPMDQRPPAQPRTPQEGMSDIWMGMPPELRSPQGTRTPQDGMSSISPVNPATGLRFDERTGQYTSAPMPTAEQNTAARYAAAGQAPPAQDGQMGFHVLPSANQEQRVPQGFQMPGQRWGQQQAGPALGGPAVQAPGRPMGMAQPGTQLGQRYTTSAFTQALLKNRAVPNAGALQNNGAYMTQQQMQKEINPNKVRGQDFLRGRDSEQKGFLANTSAAGYSDEDALGAMQKNAAPAFKAPTAGRMV